jgi:hypothetical protein
MHCANGLVGSSQAQLSRPAGYGLGAHPEQRNRGQRHGHAGAAAAWPIPACRWWARARRALGARGRSAGPIWWVGDVRGTPGVGRRRRRIDDRERRREAGWEVETLAGLAGELRGDSTVLEEDETVMVLAGDVLSAWRRPCGGGDIPTATCSRRGVGTGAWTVLRFGGDKDGWPRGRGASEAWRLLGVTATPWRRDGGDW